MRPSLTTTSRLRRIPVGVHTLVLRTTSGERSQDGCAIVESPAAMVAAKKAAASEVQFDAVMSLAHFTLATQYVERTAAFFERTLGYGRNPVPANSPTEVVWLDIGRGQEMHVIFVEGFSASKYEEEFGRHVAVFHPREDFPALKQRLLNEGAELIDPLRATPFERFFFREPVNGYLFEVVDAARAAP